MEFLINDACVFTNDERFKGVGMPVRSYFLRPTDLQHFDNIISFFQNGYFEFFSRLFDDARMENKQIQVLNHLLLIFVVL